jgi:calcium permeable stress-gated cation channel
VICVNYDWQHAIVILPTLPILIGFKFYCWKYLDPVLDYYIPDAENLDAGSPPVTVHQDVGRDKLRNRFGHPAWTQKLIAPMVHAKAKHLLPAVYHGRMDGDEEQGYNSNYGQGGGIGKVEVVQEQDLDYEHFRVSLPTKQ